MLRRRRTHPRTERRRRSAVRTALTVGVATILAAVGLVAGPHLVGHAQASVIPGSPQGPAEHMWFQPGGMRFIGWVIDPNTAAPVTVYITVDGTTIGSVLANRYRPDVGATHPSAGPYHGFDTTMRISEGLHTVCVYARNIGAGADTQLRCQRRVLDYGPVGAVDSLRTKPGAHYVRGWSLDYDKPTAPITVTITIDSTSTKVVASAPRPDVAEAKPVAGPNHGFAITLPVRQGTHTVCVRATNIGFGTNTTLLCRRFTLDDSPRGTVDTLKQQSGKLRLRGWTYDPDQPTTALKVTLKIDSALPRTITANLIRTDVAAAHPGVGNYHGFDQLLSLSEGIHKVCVIAKNVSFGSDRTLACRSVTLNFTPTASLTTLRASATGVSLTGWAADPDTSAPISVRIAIDGSTKTTVVAGAAGSTHSGHNFAVRLPSRSGTHTVCVVGLNVLYGHANSTASCRSITLALKPIGRFEKLARATGSSSLVITGWALDPDTTYPISVALTLDGTSAGNTRAGATRADIALRYPASGAAHGISVTIPATDGEHTVCLTAKNVGGGTDTSLGCKLIIAVHPVAPSAPRSVTATPGYTTATVYWTRPASDGGAPWSKYVVTASPGGRTATVGATATSATVTGLAAKTTYAFSVRAVNVAGASVAGVSPKITTLGATPPQTTPAPVSTSRYIRNVRTSTSTELAKMRAEGVADAYANPSGHAYLILLDIGGQDQYNGGVVLSATTRFVTYTDLARDLQAYTDGYHSAQQTSAPVTIAVGTNNDLNVSGTSGRDWATKVINPLVSYAKRYPNMKIAGANDIEPGFRATYTQTKSWLAGYLAATTAPFVFNGSADGCAWTVTNRSCNNGWTMAGLYYLAAGAAPTRMQNLPQIYNYTMADQWKYISLTGIGNGHPRINFGGPLTEWTACYQSGSCGSLTGRTAWTRLWNNLQSDTRLKVASLPYSTDLRIDR